MTKDERDFCGKILQYRKKMSLINNKQVGKRIDKEWCRVVK